MILTKSVSPDLKCCCYLLQLYCHSCWRCAVSSVPLKIPTHTYLRASPCLYPSQSVRRPQCEIIQLPLDYQAFFLQVATNFAFLFSSAQPEAVTWQSSCSWAPTSCTLPSTFFNISLSALLALPTDSFTIDISADNPAASHLIIALKESLPACSLSEGQFWHPTFFHHYLRQTSFLCHRPTTAIFRSCFQMLYNRLITTY